jgi:hypothetical protein
MDPDLGLSCNPAFLGPFDDDLTPVTGPVKVFEGEEKYLSARKLEARAKLCEEVTPILGRILDKEETILHVLPALHYPRLLDVLSFWVIWRLFFHATLILTDRRVIEVLMRDGWRAGTRVHSYSWGQVSDLKMGKRTLKLKTAQGRTQKWKTKREDRPLLNLLAPKIRQLLPGDIHVPRPVPLWHCPECGAASPEHPKQCTQCETQFKTRGLAAVLTFALPGAGLFYAGHPILATLALFGEILLYIYVYVAFIFLVLLGLIEMVAVVIRVLEILFFTKLISAQTASVLVHRTKADRVNTKWRRAAIVGAVASLVLLALPPILSGSFGNKLDRDLDLSANAFGWIGGHDPNQWQFGVEEDQRSEWIRDDGQALFVWSWALSAGETYETLTAHIGGQKAHVPISITDLDGFRVEQSDVDDEGDTYVWVRWVLFDRQFDDVHVVGAVVYPGGVEAFEADINELLQNAAWIPAD